MAYRSLIAMLIPIVWQRASYIASRPATWCQVSFGAPAATLGTRLDGAD
jgi:hypothetical protein